MVIDTGWVAVNNGNVSYVDIPNGQIQSIQVRWRGKRKTEYSYTTTSASDSGSTSNSDSKSGTLTPGSPGGSWSLYQVGGSVSISMWDAAASVVGVTVPGKSRKSNYLASASSNSVSDSTSTPGGSTSVGWDISVELSGSFSASATAYWESSYYTYTQNPRITVGGQATQHTGTLGNNEESTWYSALGFVAGTNNAVTHSISGSAQADVQIRVVMSDTSGAHSGTAGLLMI